MRQGLVGRTPSRARKSLMFTLVLGAALLALPSAASAATQLVSPGGTDSADCTVTACEHIQAAVNAAAPNDTVSIAAGTYASEPNNQVRVTKALTIAGAGIGNTILSGNDAHSLPNHGTLSIDAPGAVSVSGITIRNPGALGAAHGTDDHRAIYTRSLADIATAPSYSFDGVRVEGEGTGGRDYGFAVVGSTADVVIVNSEFTGQDFNAILLERNQGTVNVSDNTITRTAGTTLSSAIFDMNYSPGLAGNPSGVAQGRNYERNTIDAGGASGIAVNARPTFGTAPLGGYEYVDIVDNAVSNVGAATLAISLSNDTTDTDGSDARIQDADVNGNTLTGSGGTSTGIRFRGLITGLEATGNQITGFGRGVRIATSAAAPHGPAAATVRFNRLVDNVTTQLDDTAGASIDARDNWWGCNEGPNANVADCGSVTGGDIDFDPWLVLGISAAPSSIEVGGQNSTVSANLNFNSDEVSVGTVHPNGFPVAWQTDLGTIAPSSSPLAVGIATSTLTSGPIAGTANPAGTVDNETVSVPVEFTDNGIPETQIDSGPTNGVTIANNTANFEFSSPNDPAATFECRIDSADPADFAPCVSPFTTPALADGPHVFEVRAVDVNNNVDPSPSRVTFVVDTTPDQGGVAGAVSDKLEGACDNEIRGDGTANKIKGTKGGDRILGFGAGDTLRGLGGYDCLKGSTGDDNLDGGVAGDILQGGAGDDTARSRDGKRDKINCGAGDDTALVDQRDIVKNCETIRVRKQLKVG
jgi:hypothetical protein